MSFKKLLLSEKTFWTILLIGHLLILVVLYCNFGFNTLNEGDKYLTRASYFAQGDFVNSTQYQTFYIAYVIYLSLFIFFKIPIFLIFLSTYLISVFSYLKFYKLISNTINHQTGRLWLLMISFSPLIHYWQFNLFSETFFIAISLLLVYVCLFPQLKYRFFKIGFLVLVVIFSRPSGVFTVICTLLFVVYKNNLITKKNTVIIGLLALISLFIGIVFFFQLPYHDFSKYISNGSIYYGFPGWFSPELPPGNYTLYNCYEFIFHNKGLKTLIFLFYQKFNSFFLTTRAYYSNFHNLINKSHHILYVFALLSLIISYKKEKWVFRFLATFFLIILLNALMVSLIFNEWSERHTVHVFPYIMLLASYSLIYLYRNYFKKSI
jgi:hypothetical protein